MVGEQDADTNQGAGSCPFTEQQDPDAHRGLAMKVRRARGGLGSVLLSRGTASRQNCRMGDLSKGAPGNLAPSFL